jgi:hypothetical protein
MDKNHERRASEDAERDETEVVGDETELVGAIFADLVMARFHAQHELTELGRAGASWKHFISLRRRFKEAEGAIQREYWGANLPLGLVLTVAPKRRLSEWLHRPPRMRLHRAAFGIGSMPARFHDALLDGDMLAVRASWSLGDESRHTVLARIFEAQEFLLNLADQSGGRVAEDTGDVTAVRQVERQ